MVRGDCLTVCSTRPRRRRRLGARWNGEAAIPRFRGTRQTRQRPDSGLLRSFFSDFSFFRGPVSGPSRDQTRLLRSSLMISASFSTCVPQSVSSTIVSTSSCGRVSRSIAALLNFSSASLSTIPARGMSSRATPLRYSSIPAFPLRGNLLRGRQRSPRSSA